MRMNIFHKVALQGLMRNRTRTLVTVLGVVLSAALFTGIVTFGTSLMQYMINVEIAKGGDWHVVFQRRTLPLCRGGRKIRKRRERSVMKIWAMHFWIMSKKRVQKNRISSSQVSGRKPLRNCPST